MHGNWRFFIMYLFLDSGDSLIGIFLALEH